MGGLVDTVFIVAIMPMTLAKIGPCYFGHFNAEVQEKREKMTRRIASLYIRKSLFAPGEVLGEKRLI